MSKYMSEQNFNDLVEVLKTKYMHLELAEKYMLQYVFPVGAVYESISDISPETFIGGKWTKATSSGWTTNTLTVNGDSKTVYSWVRTE
jgi:hypothetical protein